MASIIPGFEYDIFISYRQKDNKGEKWVSEFVESLETELESTFKENVSVYFDINSHDELLETYEVTDSLKRKLKCLIFIPIISRTYCDPNSFAWANEFQMFAEQSATDQFGVKINLRNGNVISRILPVRIHELDPEDRKLCESVLGGPLRGVEFVYKSSGVNRPLRSTEEHPRDNNNKTYYRDQINKVANSIKDIIYGMKYSEMSTEPIQQNIETATRSVNSKKRLNKTIIFFSVFLLVSICISVIYMYSRMISKNKSENTITVIPTTNPNNDPVLYISAIGSMDAVITKLQDIKNLTVRGRLTSLQYLDTKKPIEELRKELKSNYLVTINLSRSSGKLLMLIGLTETRIDKELWTQQFDWNEGQLMPLFTKVVQTIGAKLNINFTNQEILNIEKDLTSDPDAYFNYLTASAGLLSAMDNKFLDTTSFRTAIGFYDKAIEKDPNFANAYARRSIARSWGIYNHEIPLSERMKSLSDINAAAKINNELPDVYIARGFYYYYMTEDYKNAIMSFNLAAEKDPESYLPIFYMAMVYRAMDNWKEVQTHLSKVIKFDLQDPLILTNIGLCYEYLHDFDSAIIFHQKAIDVNKDWKAAYDNKFGALTLKYSNTTEAHTFLNKIITTFPDKHLEEQITLDIYDGKYFEALNKAIKSSPGEFSSKGARYLCLGNISLLLKDRSTANNYFVKALSEFKIEMDSDTTDAWIYANKGLALAGLGDEQAISEGVKAVQMSRKVSKIKENQMLLNLAEIYTKLGMHKNAIENIEYVLNSPSLFSTKLLQLDPVWKPLMSSQEIKSILAKGDNELFDSNNNL